MDWSLPRFRVQTKDSTGLLVGRVSSERVCHETWVADGNLGYLLSAGALTEGRWRRVGDSWGFLPRQPLADEPAQGQFAVLDGYWGERAAIVLVPPPNQWRQQVWDDLAEHHHCAI